MAFGRLEDTLYADPRTAEAGNQAMGLWVRAFSYCVHHRTDGRIPRWFVRGHLKSAEKLILVGYWERDGENYIMHNYLKWNLSAAQIAARSREIQILRSEAGKRGAGQRWQPDDKPDSKPDGNDDDKLMAISKEKISQEKRGQNNRRVYNLADRAQEIERTLEGNSDLRDFLAPDRSD